MSSWEQVVPLGGHQPSTSSQAQLSPKRLGPRGQTQPFNAHCRCCSTKPKSTFPYCIYTLIWHDTDTFLLRWYLPNQNPFICSLPSILALPCTPVAIHVSYKTKANTIPYLALPQKTHHTQYWSLVAYTLISRFVFVHAALITDAGIQFLARNSFWPTGTQHTSFSVLNLLVL